MIESEDGTVTGSIDVSKLGQIDPKTDEAKAQIEALKTESQAAQEQSAADAEKVAAQEKAQSPREQAAADVERLNAPADEKPTSRKSASSGKE